MEARAGTPPDQKIGFGLAAGGKKREGPMFRAMEIQTCRIYQYATS